MPQVIPPRPPGQISLETGLLVQYFANWRPLEQRGYEVIKKETGIDIQASPGNARYQSAARILRRAPYHVDLSTVRGKGVIRNDSARSMQEAEGGARQIRRCVRRRKARINCIDLEALSEDEHKRVQTLAAQLNVIDQFASPRSRRIIEQEIIQPREKLPVEQVLLAFMRKKK